MQKKALLAMSTALLLEACTTTPFHGSYVDLSLNDATQTQAFGKQVLWGGVVLGERLTDAGDCVEIGQFPIDRFSGRPQNTFTEPERRLGFTERHAPRFLACGANVDADSYRQGARISIVGTIERAQVFSMPTSSCEEHQDTFVRDGSRYASTPHILADGTCVVAIPMLQVTDARVWKERPSQYTTAQSWATNG